MSDCVDVRATTGAPARMSDAMLRSLGGSVAMLRMPGNAAVSQDAEQLGLSEPAFEEIAIGPAVYRRTMVTKADGKGDRAELLVSATKVLEIVGTLGYASSNALFAQAAGVVMHGTLFQIMGANAAEILGRPYLYRLQLRGALNVVV
jgi:hypothetical protein